MKTAFQIRMDFNKANRQAAELDDLAEKIKRIGTNKLGDALNEVRASWTGENASMFIQKGNLVGNQLVNHSKNLRNTAATIRRIAKRIYDAEMAALEAISD